MAASALRVQPQVAQAKVGTGPAHKNAVGNDRRMSLLIERRTVSLPRSPPRTLSREHRVRTRRPDIQRACRASADLLRWERAARVAAGCGTTVPGTSGA